MDDENKNPFEDDDQHDEREGEKSPPFSYHHEDEDEDVFGLGENDELESDPLTEEYEPIEPSSSHEEDRLGADARLHAVSSEGSEEDTDEDDYQFLDEDEMSELELEQDEAELASQGGIMQTIRSKIEPIIGEDNFDRLKGMAIPIVIVVIFILFTLSKLADLFSTPTPATALRQPTTQTQFTQVETPKKPTVEITRPGDSASAATVTETDNSAEIQTLQSGSGFTMPQTGETSSGTDQTTAPNMAQPAPAVSGLASGWQAFVGGGDDAKPGFQLQPGQPGFTAAVPTNETSSGMVKMLQQQHAEQSEKFTSQLAELDEQAKGMDERMLRIEKMQESLDKKMGNINSQLEKVGESLAMLSKTLKEQPVRQAAAPTRAAQQPAAATSPHHHLPAPPAVSGHAHDHPQGHKHMPMMHRADDHRPGGVSFETPYYHVEAVVPGRAWLRDHSGTTITVSKGDQIRGYGYVTNIDPENGVVVTSSGIVIRYGISTR